MTAPQVTLSTDQPTYTRGAPVVLTAVVTGRNTTSTSEPVDLTGPDPAGGVEVLEGTQTWTDPDQLTASCQDAAGVTWAPQSATQAGQVLTAVFTGTASSTGQPVSVTATDSATGESGTAQITLAVTPPPAFMIGATLAPGSYGMTNWLAAAQRFDGCAGATLATAAQKYYLREAQWPLTLPAAMRQLGGCCWLVSVKPSRSMTTAEQANLRAFIQMLKAAGIRFRCVLWQEMNLPDMRAVPVRPFFATAADWLAYWAYYAPVILAEGVACDYDPTVDVSHGALALSYFPISPLPSAVWCDYYGSMYIKGARVDALFALAAKYGLACGFAEWANTASPGIVLTPTQFAGYTACITQVITSWTAAGNQVSGVIWYASDAAGDTGKGPNMLYGPGSYMAAGIAGVSRAAGLVTA